MSPRELKKKYDEASEAVILFLEDPKNQHLHTRRWDLDSAKQQLLRYKYHDKNKLEATQPAMLAAISAITAEMKVVEEAEEKQRTLQTTERDAREAYLKSLKAGS